MNWQEYIDSEVGDRETFTNAEVRAKIRRALEHITDCWINHTR